MSPSELNSIGHYYLHNNPENFLESLKRTGITNLKKMEEIVDNAMKGLMKSHSSDLTRLVNELRRKINQESWGFIKNENVYDKKKEANLFIRTLMT